MFPISRDPPEGGTSLHGNGINFVLQVFPISRDPPEGGTYNIPGSKPVIEPPKFPISRDPPEGGTIKNQIALVVKLPLFPISRDPPEGGTPRPSRRTQLTLTSGFQFLGIPPKGEPTSVTATSSTSLHVSNF